MNDIKKSLGIESGNHWDTNAISPGTEFMSKLSDRINAYILCSPVFKKRTVIFSDSSSPGEGEHKIINYIKQNKTDGNIIIYGLDADLIMLSLTCDRYNIFLLREHILNGKVVENEYKYLNIDRLRSNLILDYNYRYNKDHHNSNIVLNSNILHDYIFICFFLGNDFIPHMLSLDLKYNGLDIIMDLYIYIHTLTDEFFIINNKINKQFLKLFVKKLAEKEDDTVNLIFSKRINYNRYFKVRADNDLDKQTELLNNRPIIEMDKEFLITKNKFNTTHWKYNYYRYCLDIDTQEEIEHTCHNYLEGIYWTFEYYFNGCVSWRWKYRYNYAPTLGDLNKFLNKDPDIKFKKDKPVKPVVQLLCILPRESIHIIPKNYQKYMTDTSLGLTHLYPDSYELSMIFKRYYWQCVPILPDINHNLISLIK